jgi:hypothetical protein
VRRLEGVVVALWVAAGAGVAGLAGAAMLASGQLPASGMTPRADAAEPKAGASQLAGQEPVYRSAVLSNDEWMGSLRSEQAWTRRKGSGASAPASKLGVPPPKQVPAAAQPWGLFGSWGFGEDGETPPPPPVQQSRTYRTVCVRLCDGYFFPISFSTTRERFSADEAACQSKCSSGAKLFVYRNPGENPDDMVDVNGRAYSKLPTAFLYRTAYDASCKCTPHPWEQEAKVRHRIYALEAQRRKGNRDVVAELKERKSTAKPVGQDNARGRRGKDKAEVVKQQAALLGGPTGAQALVPPVTTVVESGAGKIPVPELADLPAIRQKGKSGSRVASGQAKPMRLGASGLPPKGSSGSEWKSRVLGAGPGL